MNDLVGLILIPVLVLLNGFFVAAEYALVSVRRARIDQLAEEGNAAARATQRAVKHLEPYISATQLGITVASLGLGLLIWPLARRLIAPALPGLGLTPAAADAVAVALAFLLVTALHVTLGEYLPKNWALQRSEAASLSVIRPLFVFTALLGWLIAALRAAGNGLVRLLGLRPVPGHHTAYSEEEIRMIVSASSQEGVLEDSEKELVYNVFDLSDTTVREIMTPRVEMVLVDSASPLRRLLELNAQHGYSRVPVYQDSTDNIVGIAHTSDVLSHLEGLDHSTVADVMRPVFFVPEGMKIKDLLTKFREKKSHLSIVVDEFGGTSGLVTLEDALEEIVGEIYDETDEEEKPMIEVLEGGVYLMDAGLTVHEVEQRLGSNIEDGEGEFDTLSGFMTGHFGDIPEAGQSFVHNGWCFTVEDADQRRVQRVRVERAAYPELLPHPEESLSDER